MQKIECRLIKKVMQTAQKNNKKATNITRKEALKKIGDYSKYTALTALGTFVLLHPKKAQAASPTNPGTGF